MFSLNLDYIGGVLSQTLVKLGANCKKVGANSTGGETGITISWTDISDLYCRKG